MYEVFAKDISATCTTNVKLEMFACSSIKFLANVTIIGFADFDNFADLYAAL
jgi:hypothetical protein